MNLVIDPGFRPEIDEFMGSRGSEFLEAWGINPAGTPVHGPEGHRSSLWYGQRYNHNDETIGWVMVMPDGTKFPQGLHDATYYFGTAARSVVEAAPVKTEAIVDSATNLWRPPTGDLPLKSLVQVITVFAPPPRA